MSERDFAMALAMLAEAFGEKHLTPVRIEAYHRSLRDVPMPLLNAAVRKAIDTRQFFPKVAELRMDAEACRLELQRANAFEPCGSCSCGWEDIRIDGIHRGVRRCWCWIAHQEKLAALGVGREPLALPVGAGSHE